MESILVGVIVGGAVIYSLRRFVKIYRGEKGCSCSNGCSCSSHPECARSFPIVPKK